MDLTLVKSLLTDDMREAMLRLSSRQAVDYQAPAMRDLSRLFQGLAICHLLIDADVPRYRANLVRSAQARRYFLHRAQVEQDSSCRFLGIARSEAIFDAIAAGANDRAQELVNMSIRQWHPNWEYEDDFCYYLFVHGLVLDLGFADSAQAVEIVKRFDRALEGQASARLGLCKALQSKDTATMRVAIERFLAERKASLDERREQLTEETAQALFWPQSFVSTEALAWLAFAAKAGMSLDDDEFLYCPRLVRQFDQALLFVEDMFVSLDEALDEPNE